MNRGPGFLVAAAFIGPGTVTACTLAGATHGMTLLWVLGFAVLAAIVLQEMSARLALTTRAGLAEALLARPVWGPAVAWGTGGAVLLGVLAFEAGNLSGAAIGMADLAGTGPDAWTLLIAILAAALLLAGNYRAVERVLIACVAVMALVFIATAIAVRPDPGALLRGLAIPSVPAGAGITVLALIGTTIVPYNLYLHAGAVRARWADAASIPDARRDLVLAIVIGGVISAAILITAASSLGGKDVNSAADMAVQLEPLLGPWARAFFAIGLATAGLTSAITAPLAAGWVVSGLMRRDAALTSPTTRATMLIALAAGAFIALSGVRPIELILLAQAANGLILPIITAALLLALNDGAALGAQRNRWRANLAGGLVLALCLALAARTLLS